MKIGIVKEQGLAGSDKRAILLPKEVRKIVKAGHKVFVEKGLGEGIFIAGRKRIAMKVIASYAEDQIITSSPEQVKKIKEEKRRVSQLPSMGTGGIKPLPRKRL